MKKKLLSVVAISALLAGGLSLLASCNSGNNKSNGGDESSQKVSGKFTVSYTQSEDYEVSGLKEEYAPGETVTFTVTVKNSGKEISSVRFNNQKITPNTDGSYSFVMPEDNVSLRITLGDKVEPVLATSFSGITMVGQTITISATIDEIPVSDFTITVKSGANLVTVNGKQVTLNAVGTVTFEISATQAGQSLKKELNITIFPSEETYGVDIAYDDHEPMTGIETSTATNLGKLVINSNDGGDIINYSYNKANNQYTMDYANGWTFHSVQLFYRLPYAVSGDSYHLAWDFISDVAGKMTINGQVIDVQSGANYVSLDITQGSGALVSIQFGVNGTEDLLSGSQIKFSPFRLYDNDKTHVYYHVTFANGNEILKDIYVRSGKTVEAPAFDPGDEYFYGGFYDGETPYLSSTAVTKDCAFVANLVKKTAENTVHVTIKVGGKTIRVLDVLKNSAMLLPADLDIGFGRKVVGYFTDAAFTQAYNLDTPVTADFDLYIKVRIQFEATYTHNFSFQEQWIFYNDDGSARIHFTGRGLSDSWHIQANFDKSVPIGETGKTYTISFVYSMNVAGARYQIYDGNSYGAGNFEIGNNLSGSITYDGGTLKNGRYLTFEFGSIENGADVEFVLHDIQLTVA